MALIGLAFIWGFSEATFFFLVPDILLTWIVLFRRCLIFKSLYVAVAGAIIGGILMYVAGINHQVEMNSFLDSIPAISAILIEQSTANMRSEPMYAIFVGGFTGTPYKIYAVNAHSAEIGLALFISISLVTRLSRWIVICSILHLADKHFFNSMSNKTKLISLVISWVIFYSCYFYLMPN